MGAYGRCLWPLGAYVIEPQNLGSLIVVLNLNLQCTTQPHMNQHTAMVVAVAVAATLPWRENSSMDLGVSAFPFEGIGAIVVVLSGLCVCMLMGVLYAPLCALYNPKQEAANMAANCAA